jgi:hypothetical protein
MRTVVLIVFSMATLHAIENQTALALETVIPVDPTGAAAAFFQAAAAKDVDRLVELTAPVAEAARPAVRAYSEKVAGRPAPAIVAHLQLPKTAVVVFLDKPLGTGPIDLDPAYLVRRDGRWLLLYRLTRFDREELELSDEERGEFQRLDAWFKTQKPMLQELLRNPG